MISTAQTRYTIETLTDSTRFSYPAGGARCSSLFLVVWLCGWAVGEVFVSWTLVSGLVQFLGGGETFFRPEMLLMVVWLAFWTLGGAFALYTVFMQLVGRAVIDVSHNSIKIAKKAFGLGFGKTYNAINIDNLRVDESLPQVAATTDQIPLPMLARFMQSAVVAGGALVFDYGGSSVRFGSGLSYDEARQLLVEIVRRYPQYRTQADS